MKSVEHISSVSSHSDYLLFQVQSKVRSFQDTIRDLEKNLETRKQEEAALLNEIEVTGQAFEDMQEQNSRLLSQLREKDDAHIKLMVERVKLQQSQKIMSDEKTVLMQQTNVLQEQLDAQVNFFFVFILIFIVHIDRNESKI